MTITPVSSDVRIVNYGSPFSLDENILVERRVNPPGEPERWERHWGTNELSNDYAYTEARATARALADRILQGGRHV